MNKAAILELAAFIEKAEFTFNMYNGWPQPSCGSAGCIGGHAAVLWPELRDNAGLVQDDAFTWNGAKLLSKLDISRGHEQALCQMTDSRYGFSNVHREDAVAVLHRFIATGEVDWDFVLDSKITPLTP